MTLPASGQISLNDISVEAGGGTDINDARIRDLIWATSGNPIDFADFYGVTFAGVGADWGGTAYTESVEASPFSNFVRVTVYSDGTFVIGKQGIGAYSETTYYWHTDPPPGTTYKAYWQHISGVPEDASAPNNTPTTISEFWVGIQTTLGGTGSASFWIWIKRGSDGYAYQQRFNFSIT